MKPNSLLLISSFVFGFCSSRAMAQQPQSELTPRNLPSSARISVGRDVDLARVPLAFERNEGQAEAKVKFVAQGASATVLLSDHEAVVDIAELRRAGRKTPGDLARISDVSASHSTLHLVLSGANGGAQVVGEEELPGKVNYLVG